MFRPILSYTLTSLILMAQIGLPLHFHYCKGILEKVSILVSSVCDDHAEVPDLPSCCKKVEATHCQAEKDDCCDDRVLVLTQDLTSLIPHWVKWTSMTYVSVAVPILEVLPHVHNHGQPTSAIQADSGPPIYILHQALIFYA